MNRFGRKPRETDPDEAAARQAVGELIDRYHSRASISDGERMLIEPGKALENIALAMERVDTDIDTPISIEEDVVSFSELASLIQNMLMGPTLAVHVLNTAMKIMSARYPADLVRTPLPPEYDLRKLVPFDISDEHHELAKTLFNRRTTRPTDLSEGDIAEEMEPLDVQGQIQIFVILFYMFGTKLGALKHRTGID